MAGNKFFASKKGEYLLLAEAEDEYGNPARTAFTVLIG